MKSLKKNISPVSFFIIKLSFIYAILFFINRILFVLINKPSHYKEGFSTSFMAFFLGLRFDFVIISIILIVPFLMVSTHYFFVRKKIILVISRYYLYLISFLIFFIVCADIPYFSQFGTHINKSIFVWQFSYNYTIQLIVSDFYYWSFFILFLIFYLGFILVCNKIFKEYAVHVSSEIKNKLSIGIINLLIISLLFFIAARGRLSSKSTIHEGMAIINQTVFTNQIALNANYTLFKSISRNENKVEYLKTIKSDLTYCYQFFNQNYFPKNGILENQIIQKDSNQSIKKLNVIVVLMESFSIAKMGYYNCKNTSPFLTEFAKESVFFDRFFSSGIHTFNGLYSTASGFPSIYTQQGLRQNTKKPFTTLANLVLPFGYSTYFCCTHDPVFDNMEGFFKLNGFNTILSDKDFKSSQSIGVTGIPDHLLYKKFISKINLEPKNKPFLAYIMTGSDHGPWNIPTDISFKPNGQSVKENTSLYADWAVKQFITEAKKQNWYKNTVFVFLADHGQIINSDYSDFITYHHIPLIIHCPQQLKPQVIHHLGYQEDVIKTVSSILKINYKNFSFGENIFEKNRPFVFFIADDRMQYVTDDDFYFSHILSLNEKSFINYKSKNTQNRYSEFKNRADSLYKKMMSLYNSANYYTEKNYNNE